MKVTAIFLAFFGDAVTASCVGCYRKSKGCCESLHTCATLYLVLGMELTRRVFVITKAGPLDSYWPDAFAQSNNLSQNEYNMRVDGCRVLQPHPLQPNMYIFAETKM